MLAVLLVASSLTGSVALAQQDVSAPQAPQNDQTAPLNPAAQQQPGRYTMTIPLRTVTRAGITPNTGYVLLSDVKTLIDVSASGTRYTLKTARSTVRFTAGSRRATLNGRPAALNGTPVMLSETLLYPLASLALLGCSAQPQEPMRNVRAFTVTCDDQDSAVSLSVLTFNNTNAGPGNVQPSAGEISRLRR